MSHKAFYQTFFQTEQLFRRADDVMTFPARAGLMPDLDTIEQLAANGMVPESADDVPASAPTVLIFDPVIPVPAAEVSQPALDEVLASAASPEPVQVLIDVPAPRPEPAAKPAATPPLPTPLRPATPLISQKVLILVDEDLLPSDLLFLEKILKAVHLDIDGVDLLNVHGTKTINFAELLAGKYIHHFFTFGVPFSRLNLDIMMDRYHPVRFEGITFLMADPLPAIEADVALKKKLWESLKKVFLWR